MKADAKTRGKRKRPANRISTDLAKVSRVPDGQPFVAHTRELITSPAWRARTISARRLVEYLELEHLNHAGTMNGLLGATYGQLEAWGIGRRLINAAIREAEALGLVEVRRGGRASYAKDNPTRFRLTYLPDRNVDEFGKVYYGTGTNEWKRITTEKAEQITGIPVRPLNQEIVHEGELPKCTKVHQQAVSGSENPQKTVTPIAPPIVHEGEPPSKDSHSEPAAGRSAHMASEQSPASAPDGAEHPDHDLIDHQNGENQPAKKNGRSVVVDLRVVNPCVQGEHFDPAAYHDKLAREITTHCRVGIATAWEIMAALPGPEITDLCRKAQKGSLAKADILKALKSAQTRQAAAQ